MLEQFFHRSRSESAIVAEAPHGEQPNATAEQKEKGGHSLSTLSCIQVCVLLTKDNRIPYFD